VYYIGPVAQLAFTQKATKDTKTELVLQEEAGPQR